MSYNDEFLVLPDHVLNKMANEYYTQLSQKNSSQSQQNNIIQLASIMSDCFYSLQQMDKIGLPSLLQNKISDLQQVLKQNQENLFLCYNFLTKAQQSSQFNNNIFSSFCNMLEGVNMLFDIIEYENKMYNKNMLIKMQKITIKSIKNAIMCLSDSNVKIFKYF